MNSVHGDRNYSDDDDDDNEMGDISSIFLLDLVVMTSAKTWWRLRR
jgi:hypothetical protein